jgi:histone-lysine N-methyltransferase SETD1
VEGDAISEEKEKRGLKGLSFKKNRVAKPQPLPSVDEHLVQEASPQPEVDEDHVEELEAQRPKKRQKVATEDIVEPEPEISPAEEEAEEEECPLSPQDNATKRKEPPIADSEDVRPIKKSKATAKKKAEKKQPVIEEQSPVTDVVIPGDVDIPVPVITEFRLSVDRDSSSFTTPEPASIPSDPIADGLFEDDEDMYFAKLALSRDSDGEFTIPLARIVGVEEPDPDAPPPFRVHSTGSARTEGYYKITHAEKSAYVTQYTAQAKVASKDVITEPAVSAPTPVVTSSRSNRANARRRAQGIEEINQMQRAMQLSLGETPATDQVKFNQLQTRKKHLRFARSPIHDWGLYAMERIARGEMVIEYVGEVIRAAVADKREKAYERQGIGSSYLFRIDEDLVVDATKKGNLGYVSLLPTWCLF